MKAIVGLHTVTVGTIELGSSGVLGICPQEELSLKRPHRPLDVDRRNCKTKLTRRLDIANDKNTSPQSQKYLHVNEKV
jgi:hypothetical protein